MIYRTCPDKPRWRGRVSAWLKRPLSHQLRSIAVKTGRVGRLIEDMLFEKRHGLNCRGFIESNDLETVHAAALSHSQAYQAISCATLRELLDEAMKTGIAFDHFIDLGSGKGKACFYVAAKYRFEKIIGVEFSGPLVEAANANARNFTKKSRSDNIRFINKDAAAFSLPIGNNLIFLFNPFGERILQQFLDNNAQRFRQSSSVIAYANDKHRLCLAKAGFVTLFRNQYSSGSLHQFMSD